MEISEIRDSATGFVALAALLGFVLLLPLFLSQRRDVRRMRAWMEREPEHPASDIAASEALLDRAETELEELLEEELEPAATPAAAAPAATRVTYERPALERITMERAALAPHPHWRRFASRATQPRVLVAIGIVALLLGGGAIFVSEELLKGGEDGDGAPRAGAIDRGDVTVAVLNGTSVNGLAGKVSADIAASGYRTGTVSSTAPGFAKTVVFYDDGQKRAAQKVARDLGIDKDTVEPLDRDTGRLAGGANVVVVAGEDRAS